MVGDWGRSPRSQRNVANCTRSKSIFCVTRGVKASMLIYTNLYTQELSYRKQIVTLKCELEVTEGFVFVFRSNYGAIFYRLQDIATYWTKIAKFVYRTCTE